MNIFDKYSAYELRDIFRKPTQDWPQDFSEYMHRVMADSLLDVWLGDHTDEEYREEMRQYVEDLTYGYNDKNGKEMLDFDDTIDDNGNYLLRFNK